MKNYDVLDILSNKKVLYAEDEDGIRRNVVEILELFFEKVVAVNDGNQVMQEISLSSYDVLIVDICMPNMDGLEAIEKVRKKDKKLPVIVLSAHTEQNYLWRAVELKITKYLRKPYDKNTLIEALKMVALELVDNNDQKKLAQNCVYDFCTKTVLNDNENIKLSKSESRLLEYFIKRANQIITFDDIYDYVWEHDIPSKEAIKSLIKDIRKKIAKECIKNVYGVGYIIEI